MGVEGGDVDAEGAIEARLRRTMSCPLPPPVLRVPTEVGGVALRGLGVPPRARVLLTPLLARPCYTLSSLSSSLSAPASTQSAVPTDTFPESSVEGSLGRAHMREKVQAKRQYRSWRSP